MKMTLIKVDETQVEVLPSGIRRRVLVNEKIGSKYSIVNYAEVPPGAVNEHVRQGEEMVYIISGEMVVDIREEESHTLTPGSLIFIPTGVKHRHRNLGKAPVKLLFFLAGPNLKQQ